ncbi:MAG: S-methyl-5-thioribose-1-phosphate isomerase [Elusimicrobia bacterium]|nr:S-methyl-5-thioribose-1-phosphate isomerase [Elusimicrobiota bacterium]
MSAEIKQVYWRGGSLYVLDQRLLPHRTKYIRCGTPESVAAAIRDMALRGAPLIGGAAAYGFALAAKSLPSDPKRWWPALDRAAKTLKASRPTAVNLMHGVDHMLAAAERLLFRKEIGAVEFYKGLKEEADRFFDEDASWNRRMGELGSKLLKRGSTVITYCNTGALATCGLGTALGVIRTAYKHGKIKHVYACETRPYMQGSRLTLWELMRAGIPSTLITDNMAAHLMATERIDAIFVGSDRIAANADVANKIGTYGLSILARHHGIPFYVVAPSTTVDLRTKHGRLIPIEERSAREVVEIGGRLFAPKGAKARHPAFDVTPSRLVTAIVTERGVVRPPNARTLRKVIAPKP